MIVIQQQAWLDRSACCSRDEFPSPPPPSNVHAYAADFE